MMITYTSQGTISVYRNFCTGADNCKYEVFFVPENAYSIKHGNKTFAVFVPKSCGCAPKSCDCTLKSCNKAVIRKYDRDKGNGVKIGVCSSGCKEVMSIISSAALHQTKVKVEVEVKITLKKDEIDKVADAAADAKAAEQELMKIIIKAVQCSEMKLTGITIPAK